MTKRFLPLLAFLALAGCSGPNNKAEIKLATPSPQQIDFMNNEIGCIFSFYDQHLHRSRARRRYGYAGRFQPDEIGCRPVDGSGQKPRCEICRTDGHATKTVSACGPQRPLNTAYATHRGKTAGATSSKSSSRRARRHGIKPGLYFSRTTTDTKYSNPRTGQSSGGKCGTVSRICAGRIRHSSKNTASWKWTRSPNC